MADCRWCGGDGRVFGVIDGWIDCPYCDGDGVERDIQGSKLEVFEE